MSEQEEREKAEKLAAAKKRVAQLQKKKKATEKAGSSTKGDPKGSEKSQEKAESVAASAVTEERKSAAVIDSPSANTAVITETPKHTNVDEEDDFNSAIATASASQQDDAGAAVISASASPSSTARAHPARQPSTSLQSKIRSESFRRASTTSAGPDDSQEGSEEVPDIYRKQLARIEALETENRRLVREAQEAREKWHKTEEELEELREESSSRSTKAAVNGTSSEEVAKLQAELNALQLVQKQSNASTRTKSADDVQQLQKSLEAKDSTITSLQLEISRLRSQLAAFSSGSADHNEQISALREALSASQNSILGYQTAAAEAEQSLAELKETVSQDTSGAAAEAEGKDRDRQIAQLSSARDDAIKKQESLEKKIDAMTKLHRESEVRAAPRLTLADNLQKELLVLRQRYETSEKENARLREARKARISSDGAAAEIDELEDEKYADLERRYRELETENFDLRRGVWREKRTALQPGMGDGSTNGDDQFDEVDLNANSMTNRKSPGLPFTGTHSSFAQVINSGLAAFLPSATPDNARSTGRPRNDSLLEDFDEDEFDENAFARAAQEEEAKKMVEHVREVKRGLKQWLGWQLDLREQRRAMGPVPGYGEIFEA